MIPRGKSAGPGNAKLIAAGRPGQDSFTRRNPSLRRRRHSRRLSGQDGIVTDWPTGLPAHIAENRKLVPPASSVSTMR